MADNPKATVEIEVDLDETSLERQMGRINQLLGEGTKRAALDAEKNLTKTFSKQLNESIKSSKSEILKLNNRLVETGAISKETNLSVQNLVSSIADISDILNVTITVVSLLENRFDILSNTLDIIGIDAVKLTKQFKLLTSAIVGLAVGNNSIKDVKIETGLFLRELGLVDNKLLSLIANFRGFVNFIRRLIVDIKTLSIFFAGSIPILIKLEENFGLITLAADKLGFNLIDIRVKMEKLRDIVEKFAGGESSFTSVKLAAVSLAGELGLVDAKLAAVATTALKASENVGTIAESTVKIGAAGVAAKVVANNFKDITQTGGKLKNILFKGKGLFGFTASLGALAAGFELLNRALGETNSEILKTFGIASKVAAVVLGGLAAGIGFLILKISELSQVIGTRLVGFFVEAAKSFNKAEKDLIVFSRVVENFNRLTEGSVGSVSSWNKEINNISNSFAQPTSSLRKAAQEIVAVTSQMHFNEMQMKELLKVSAEYAKVNKKDVFDTTVSIVAALNGQAQGVQKLGIKLGAAAVQQFAYKKGLTESLSAMTENEKIQLRYNKLLTQYSSIAGVAAQAANTLADQNERYELNLKRIKTALGEGARLIEQNNIAAGAANLILDNLNATVFKAAGVIGALGSRILLIGGFLLEWSFKTFGVIKAVKILNTLLLSTKGLQLFETKLPIINKSLNALFSTLSNAPVEVKGLKSLFKTLARTVAFQAKTIIASLAGVSASTLTLKGALIGVIANAKAAIIALATTIGTAIAPFLPYIAAAVAVGAALKLLWEGLKAVEERTQAFSMIWELFLSSFGGGESIISKTFSSIKSFTSFLASSARKAFGGLVQGILFLIKAFASLPNSLPVKAIENTISISMGLARAIKDIVTQGLKPFIKAWKFLTSVADGGNSTFENITEMFTSIKNSALSVAGQAFKPFIRAWNVLSESIGAGLNRLQPILIFFVRLKRAIFDVSNKAINFLGKQWDKLIGKFASLIASNPFKIFGANTVKKFEKLSSSVGGFSDSLAGAGNDLDLLGNRLRRPAARKSFLDVNLDKLAQLRSELKSSGKNVFETIKQQESDRLKLISAANKKGLLASGEFERLRRQTILDSSRQANEALLAEIGIFEQTKMQMINQQEQDRIIAANEARAARVITEMEHENLITQIKKDAQDKRAKNRKKANKRAVVETGSMGKALADIAAGTAKMFGENLVNKGNAGLQAFLGLVLDVFGEMAIAIGTAALASIFAIQGLKKSIVGTGAIGVALALGLIAIGAAMKAQGSKMSGAGGGGSVSGGSGGGLAQGGSGSADFGSGDFTDDNERSVRQNVINLNVEGNINDSDEEGTRIARTLKKSFNKDGIVLNNARFA